MKIYYGATLGPGLEIRIGKKYSGGIDSDFGIPIFSSKTKEDYENLKKIWIMNHCSLYLQ
ncbi:MAG: hypothetical protein KJ607_13190 [Bacteroidetes bacterium]|nr:hypothetical protein [Bacteroidota bacterium]